MRQPGGHYDLDISWILCLPWTGPATRLGARRTGCQPVRQVTAYGA